MPFPNPPSKIVPFNSGPVAPHDIGRQFAEHERGFRDVIEFLHEVVRDDGVVHNGTIGPEQLKPEIGKALAAQARASVEDLLADVRETARVAQMSVSDAHTVKMKVEALLRQITLSASQMDAANVEVQQRLASLNAQVAAQAQGTPTVPTGVLGPWSGDFYATDEGSAAPLAQDYAQVSIEWAEHLPDTIPPNILAINAITGDHWSSRWWANRSANAFGMLAWWYQGAWPGMPPSTPNTPTGQPIPIGAMFFNTTTGSMMVWNGTTWVNSSAPQKGISASLYYAATAGQTVFPLSVVDRHGKNFTFSTTVPEGIEVYIDGAGRLEPQFDYTVDYPGSSITLIAPAVAGAIVAIDILVPALALTPSGSANTMLISPITPDGTTTSFTGLTLVAGGSVAASKSEELYVSVDGVLQRPGTDYSAVAATITFSTAPGADSSVFMVWFGPPVVVGSGGSGAVTSVAGRTGAVVLVHSDITDWNGALASYAPISSPVFIGNPQAPTPAPGDNDTSIATTAFVANAVGGAGGGAVSSVAGKTGAVTLVHGDITDWSAQLAPYATLTSPVFSGNPQAPTPSAGDNDTSIATTAFVATAVAGVSGGGGGISDAPNDGQYYSRHNLAWTVPPAGLTDAISDGTFYGRKSGVWAHATHTDISDWTASLAPYALITSVPAASSTVPLVNGTAAIGVGTTWARADHVHPSDTSRLSTAGGTLTGGIVVQGPVDLKVQSLAAASATTINRANGENVILSLGVNVSTLSVTGWPASGVTGKVRILIANTGAFLIAGWPAGTIWPGGTAPTITSGAGKKDIVLLMSDDGGATVYGSIVGQDYR